MLPAPPLDLEWINFNPLESGAEGNFIAVATFMPQIEIWNLDILDSVQPDIMLGGSKDAVYEFGQAPTVKGAHKDAVMSISCNTERFLASGSADKKIKIWDICRETCVHTLSQHSDKVQIVAWNPKDPTSLLSAGTDWKAVITDGKDHKNQLSTKLRPNFEKAYWHPTD